MKRNEGVGGYKKQHPGVLEPTALSITPRSKALWGTSRTAVYFRGWQISWTWISLAKVHLKN